ncbi:Crp/Fnr family transcriptional regulator [Pedobacter nyackensis]|uniref:cAMP-binding domain of CRP or a regulatory subunit of cAMP-dependent protein kinases n=1 Tax=Pedobacter nyackensis TaxID=475255 RepID=A0A1W2DLC4_9SPHI|nr:Crp/Fnr family transcriptional regulator [Pedobacter nyackensis]SMC98265.1 cAMP-binding domain of CRP or a regulatory subunit of cAMP-dependent protein kinases [Pedobacter nyackensis]
MIKAFLTSFQVLTSDEISQFESLLVKRHLKKGAFFISEGKFSKEVAFINTGILRSFYTTESGEEMTYCISFPNALMTAYSAFITGMPTIENIQAIADSELLIIQKHDIDKLQESSPNWIRFSKIIAELQYLELEKRLFVFQKDKAKKRYIDLLENQPDYVQQIPLQYLASYLGITPRHLSRLRKEIQY